MSFAENLYESLIVFGTSGVVIDSSLSFSLLVQKTRLSCYRLVNICFKCFALRDPSPFLKFYKTYVLPSINSCSSIYALSSVSNINSIEKVQKYFTKRLFVRVFPSKLVPDYASRLSLFGLEPLEILLIRTDLNLFKLIRCIYSVPDLNFQFSAHSNGRLLVSRVRTTKRREFFVSRVITFWNQYVSHCTYPSLSEFRLYLSTLHFDSSLRGVAFKQGRSNI